MRDVDLMRYMLPRSHAVHTILAPTVLRASNEQAPH